jgi:hypothetical protein
MCAFYGMMVKIHVSIVLVQRHSCKMCRPSTELAPHTPTCSSTQVRTLFCSSTITELFT